MHAYLLSWWFGFGAIVACLVIGVVWRVLVVASKLSTTRGRGIFAAAYEFFRRQPGRLSPLRAVWIGLRELWINRRLI